MDRVNHTDDCKRGLMMRSPNADRDCEFLRNLDPRNERIGSTWQFREESARNRLKSIPDLFAVDLSSFKIRVPRGGNLGQSSEELHSARNTRRERDKGICRNDFHDLRVVAGKPASVTANTSVNLSCTSRSRCVRTRANVQTSRSDTCWESLWSIARPCA